MNRTREEHDADAMKEAMLLAVDTWERDQERVERIYMHPDDFDVVFGHDDAPGLRIESLRRDNGGEIDIFRAPQLFITRGTFAVSPVDGGERYASYSEYLK